jgi:hypothetical protein
MPSIGDRPDHPGVVVPGIRRQEDETPAGHQHPAHLGEDETRVVQVLENPRRGDNLESLPAERQLLTGPHHAMRDDPVPGESFRVRIQAEHHRTGRTREIIAV